MAKKKSRSVIARMVGVIPIPSGNNVFWKLRYAAPHFPFYIDSNVCESLDDAKKLAKRWKKRKITITVEM